MGALAGMLNLFGLGIDIAGFSLIGRELLKHPGNRLFGGGGDKEFRSGRAGFCLVVAGFAVQALAQVFQIVLGRT